MFKALDAVIIDEVSMVRADLMDAIDVSLRKNRKIDLPFGGVQMVIFGDLYQLPPVVREAELMEIFETKYHSPFFFSAAVFREAPLKVLELKRIFRQADLSFIDLLNRVRNNALVPEDLATLNARVRPSSNGGIEGEVLLTATNDTAERFNRSKLASIQSESFSYPAIVWGDFDESSFPTDRFLELKVGARVMLLRNDRDGRWINGTVGTVTHCDQGTVRVRVPSGEWQIEPEEWSKTKYVYDEFGGEIEPRPVGTFIQFPLKLAWAVTIHKSQGKTFDRIAVDLGRGAFAHGQVYVALSRCRTLDGIRLVSPIRASDILVDGRVLGFGVKSTEGAGGENGAG